VPDIALHEAEQILRDHGGYDWLLSGRQFWSVAEVKEQLNEVGLPVKDSAVRKWFQEIAARTPQHFQDLGGALGWRASRNGLILLFARMTGSGEIDQKATG
jgi:hypothetical protein